MYDVFLGTAIGFALGGWFEALLPANKSEVLRWAALRTIPAIGAVAVLVARYNS